MDAIREFWKIDFSYVLVSVFVILVGMKSMLSILEWFSDKLELETLWMRKRRKERDLLLIKKDLAKLSDTVNGIVATLAEMQRKDNETELKKLKDSLVRYYNKYKDAVQWSKLEKDAFWDLFDDYESRGGDGYIHSIVEPAMRGLKEMD
ncbi:MAG: hypothetical protein NC079_00625 [Clostridium sp.]|nr:hypothetical protein [Acetatifactor muris]MCM1527459.1 hypothetical protein [Bacteroides sp.]MCM1562095.1 hypothetical protein [Clostridium sp.]